MNFFKIHSIIKNNLVLPSYLDKNKLINEKDTKNKSVFGFIHAMFKDSKWTKMYSKTVDMVITLKNLIKYFFIICILACLLYCSIYYLNTNFIFIHIWKTLENWWLCTTVMMSFLAHSILGVIRIIINCFVPNLGYFVEDVTLNTADMVKKQLQEAKKKNFKKLANVTEFITYNVEENFNSFKSSFVSWFFNLKIRLTLTAKLYKHVGSTSIFNLINYFKNKTNDVVLEDDSTLCDISKKTHTNNIDVKDVYKNDIYEYLTNGNIVFINIDNQKMNENYYNSNIYNLMNNNFKSKELFKWLKNYSLIHSRSFAEASLLNLKIIPLGLNINKWSDFNNNSFFNFYFNDIKNRNILTTYSTNNKNLSTIFTNNFLLHNNELTQTFATLNKNFNWFMYRNMLLNCFTTTNNNFKFLTIKDINILNELLINKNNFFTINTIFNKNTISSNKIKTNDDTIIMLLNYSTNYKFLTINSNLLKTNNAITKLSITDDIKLKDNNFNKKLMKF